MSTVRALFDEICRSLHWPGRAGDVDLPAGGSLPSAFCVSDLAQASIGAAGASLSMLLGLSSTERPPTVSVDRDLAAGWFGMSIRPQGWEMPPVWDAVAGVYEGDDGWIRLHTNAPHHRSAALSVLGCAAERDEVARRVAGWAVEDLEVAVVEAGGAAAAMRARSAWARHPQGAAVAMEPIVALERTGAGRPDPALPGEPGRPLAGVRVLDLTRVLAGTVGTRLLAGWGAEVLRIDPPTWDEPAVVPEVTLGKHCARLDLKDPGDRDQFLDLLRSADIMVHGYRGDALDRLGLGADVREEHRPGLIDVSLDAYGWTGPWRNRRGFDSLVQMSTGIADTEAGPPRPLPVQALDQATGYLLAAGAITGLALRATDGAGSRWRASLARTAALLVDAGPPGEESKDEVVLPDPSGPSEDTAWGPALRLAPPASVDGAPLRWDLPARPLGHDPARWSTSR